MRKFLIFDDGHRVELSPLTYKEFMTLDQWSYGGSDMAFDAWLRRNGYVEASQYRQEALETAHFELSFDAIDPEKFYFQNGKDDEWYPFDPHKVTLTRYLKPSDGE